jgi:hypothetical protein
MSCLAAAKYMSGLRLTAVQMSCADDMKALSASNGLEQNQELSHRKANQDVDAAHPLVRVGGQSIA